MLRSCDLGGRATGPRGTAGLVEQPDRRGTAGLVEQPDRRGTAGLVEQPDR
ncbi:hypothetical protein COLSTE_00099 [Collinsella stercoris DSM 13279]|uniref:Uncharacterized protein n=1 Tax=Collinsella stercoris DSM 13279 TaxID=445975 RepID=B6G7Q9_9ACTN|nr:hypothetical protein COLSTE_00099 [Collinsella stercoris DSM 13279]